MSKQIPIITKVEFFDISYKPMRANVSARNYSSLTYRKSGKVLISTESGKIVSEANTLTFVPSGHAYFTEIFEEGEMIILHYQIAEGCDDFFDKPTLLRPTNNKDRFLDIFTRALAHSLVDNECACMSDAYRLFSEVLKETRQRETVPSPRLVATKRYIDENFASPELRVSELAKLHKSSEVYFRREFKKHYGESPIEYIKRRRLEKACHLLRTELYSIADVAIYSGFDATSYFSSEFKRYIGCSPKEYRTL